MSVSACDRVRDAISSGTVDASHVATLRTLLGLQSKQVEDTKPNSRAASRSAKSVQGRRPKQQVVPIPVHEDTCEPLSSKQKHALATTVVNLSLKALSTASNAVPVSKPRKGHGSDEVSGDNTPLRQRHANASPIRQRITKPDSEAAKSTRKPGSSIYEPQPTLAENLADCARLGFEFMRAVEVKVSAKCSPSQFQLETGMVALASRMVSHGLVSMAVREIRIVKRRLEQLARATGSDKQPKPPKEATTARAPRETLASLLEFDRQVKSIPATLDVALSCQLLILKVIAMSYKPSNVGECLKYLSYDSPGSIANLVDRLAAHSTDQAKAVKYLESASRMVLSLCSTASDTDGRTTFELHTLGLRMRLHWWQLAKHTPEMEREVLAPFSRSLSVLTNDRATSVKVVYAAAKEAYDQLCDSIQAHSGSIAFDIHRTLALLAEKAHRESDFLSWTSSMLIDSAPLEKGHARWVAALAKRLDATSYVSADDASPVISDLITALQMPLSGNAADYEMLLTDLSCCLRHQQSHENHQDLLLLSAKLAQKYARSYPSRATNSVYNILQSAAGQSRSVEDVAAWINEDCAALFVRDGIANDISNAAADGPWLQGWTPSKANITFGRVLQALVLRSVKTISAYRAVATDVLEDKEQLAILEWQFAYTTELAQRPHYHDGLRAVLPSMMRDLDTLYSISEHPVRRCQMACMVLRLQQAYPGLLSVDGLNVWLSDDLILENPDLRFDHGLQVFASEVKARYRIAMLMHSGKAKPADFQTILSDLRAALEAADGVSKGAPAYDPRDLVSQLQAVAAFCIATGEDLAALPSLDLICQVTRQSVGSTVKQADAYLSLAQGFADNLLVQQCKDTLAQVEALGPIDTLPLLTQCQLAVVYSQHYAAIFDGTQSQQYIKEASRLFLAIRKRDIQRQDRRRFESLHTRIWCLQSSACLEAGAPLEALDFAKQAVKFSGALWSALERQMQDTDSPDGIADEPSELDADIALLTGKVSKLQLQPKESTSGPGQQSTSIQGAPFWPLIPVHCRALTQVIRVFAHLGQYPEADYYSNRALTIAESLGPTPLLQQVVAMRCRLFIDADSHEEAELCLAKHDFEHLAAPSVARVEYIQAVAAMREKEGEFGQALKLHEEAEEVIAELADPERLRLWQSASTTLVKKVTFDQSAKQEDAPESSKVRRAPRARVATTAASAKPRAKAGSSRTQRPRTIEVAQTPHPYSDSLCRILLDSVRVSLLSRKDVEQIISRAEPLAKGIANAIGLSQARCRDLIQQAIAVVQSDVSFNVLPECSVSFPSLIASTIDSTPSRQTKSSRKADPKQRSTALSTKLSRPQEEESSHAVAESFLAAWQALTAGHSRLLQHGSAPGVHVEGSMLSNASLMLAASRGSSCAEFTPWQVASYVDGPRIAAHAREQGAIASHAGSEQGNGLPSTNVDRLTVTSERLALTEGYQSQYVDILPKSWTAVSLCLSEDCSDLYIVRYRRGQTPFTLKMPFSRHDSSEDGEEIFDYHGCKSRLQEIIEASNISCHSSSDIDTQDGKSKWWEEREALDRQLHELLINIENIWFGGFKGIMSQAKRQEELLQRFRSSFDEILSRHLPSRQTSKPSSKPLELDDQVLELFVNLGSDQDGVVDLDEALTDLLYFVVDTLQFSGERNAYDEIDFDNMVVEVLDALRSYHTAYQSDETTATHLVLVLDRRLQTIPWESMPCLDGASVSRVGSMLSLRERLVAMRLATGSREKDTHTIRRSHGTYILNPSNDLPGTQKTLGPTLSTLSDSDNNSHWSCLIASNPSEDDFRDALRTSPILLYFGHGAGSQYIRPRTIKRLDQCSEVVWLMGCSSGAITEHGIFEPVAVPLAYLLAGDKSTPSGITTPTNTKCMAIIATLWDVTDKDIDRFSLSVGESWGLWPASEASQLPAKALKRRAKLAHYPPTTPRKACPSTTITDAKTPGKKTVMPPKTPQTTRNVDARTRTPQTRAGRGVRGADAVNGSATGGADGKEEEGGRKMTLTQAVAAGRDACYLRYLNGAAPVVFGIPVALE